MDHSSANNKTPRTEKVVLQGVEMSPEAEDDNQINLITQEIEHLNVSDSEESAISYASIDRGENVDSVANSQREREMNDYFSLVPLLPFHSREQVTKMPGCYKCMLDDSCRDMWCVFCTRGFCHRGHLCKNFYSHFAMCGKGVNYCRMNRPRKYSRILRTRHSRGREQILPTNQAEGRNYSSIELWRAAVKNAKNYE